MGAASKIIAIDGRPLQGNRTGVGRYVFEICRILDHELPDVSFHVYSNRPLNFQPFSPRWCIRYEESHLRRKLKPALWLKYCAGEMVNRDDATGFWGAASFLPYGLNPQVRTLLTAYDLNYRLVPETMPFTHRLSFHLFFSGDVKRADVLTAISQGTSKRLRHFFGRGADIVVPPSADPLTFRHPADGEIAATTQRYAIEGRYFLSVATPEPRKNIDVLVDAYALLRQQGARKDVSLVLVGGGGWKNGTLDQKIAACPGIRRLGFVPDADLPALYAGAQAMVFPSRYEGFGMPLLEARLCGAMAIASDIPEMREAGGSDIVYTEPHPVTLSAAMEQILQSPRPPVPPVFTTWAESGRMMSSIFSRFLKEP